jgi:hypothetical protein
VQATQQQVPQTQSKGVWNVTPANIHKVLVYYWQQTAARPDRFGSFAPFYDWFGLCLPSLLIHVRIVVVAVVFDIVVLKAGRHSVKLCRALRIAFQVKAHRLGWIYVRLFAWLLGYLVACWLISGLVDRLVGWLLACLFACLLVCLFACLLVCLFACIVGCLFACLLAWLVGRLVGWLVGRSVNWLVVRLVD